MKTSHSLISVIVIVLIILGAFLFISPKQETEVVKIGFLPIISSLNLYVAQDNDYFTENGVTIEVIQLQSSNQLVDALVRGDIDIAAAASTVPVLAAGTIEPGIIQIFSVSDITPETPADAMIAMLESDVNSLNDLEGKKVGVFPGSTATNLLSSFLISHGVDVSNIEFIKISPPAQLSSLYSGSIDVLFAYEPSITIAMQEGKVKKIYEGSVYAEQLNHNPLSASLISSEFIKNNPKLAEKTVQAFNKASDLIKDDDSRAREVVLNHIKIDEAVAKEVVLRYMGRSDEINMEILQSFSNMLYDLGEIESKIDTSSLIYTL